MFEPETQHQSLDALTVDLVTLIYERSKDVAVLEQALDHAQADTVTTKTLRSLLEQDRAATSQLEESLARKLRRYIQDPIVTLDSVLSAR
jgi:membrane-bound ClpP family serine protease